MLNVEAVALRADGDSRDRRRERDSSRTINGEPERVQGRGQGRASQHQGGGGDDSQPVTDADCRDPRGWRRRCSRCTSKTELNLDRQKDSMESDDEVFTQTSESETVKSNPGNSSNDTKSELGSVKTGQKTNPHSKPNAEPEVRIEKGDEEWEREKGQELKEKMEVDGEEKERGRKEKKVETGVRSSTPVAPAFGARDVREKEVKSEEIPEPLQNLISS